MTSQSNPWLYTKWQRHSEQLVQAVWPLECGQGRPRTQISWSLARSLLTALCWDTTTDWHQTHRGLRNPLSVIASKSLTFQVMSSLTEGKVPAFQLADLRDSWKLHHWAVYYNSNEFKWATEGFWIPKSHRQDKGTDLNSGEGTKTMSLTEYSFSLKCFHCKGYISQD